MDIYFIPWGYNPILFDLYRCPNVWHCELFPFVLCPFDLPHRCGVLFVFLLLYLSLQDARGSSCILTDPVLESAIGPKTPDSVSFYY